MLDSLLGGGGGGMFGTIGSPLYGADGGLSGLLGGGGGGFLGGLLGGGGGGMGGTGNPADAGMKYLDQIEGKVTPFYQPYIDAGLETLPQLMQQYSSLVSNPGSVMNNIGSSFQQSPGYEFQRKQAMNASNNAAAAGGMLGTPSHQFASAKMANDLANQDYYNWLAPAVGMYNTGLAGQSGINQMGYGASNELANTLANVLQSQASMAYQGQQAMNAAAQAQAQNQASGMGSMLGGLSSMMGGGGGGGGGSSGMSSMIPLAMTALSFMSDERLKENIQKVREENGFNIYRFNYKNLPQNTYEGVMAQEVQKIMPEAVNVEENGYLSVNYDLIGLEMRKV